MPLHHHLRFAMSSRPRFNAQSVRHVRHRNFCNRPNSNADAESRYAAAGDTDHGYIPAPRGYGGWIPRPVSQPRGPGWVNRYPRPYGFQPPVRPNWGYNYAPHRVGYPTRPPKMEDHRNWVFARSQPPPDSERFVVVSYNILADYLAKDHRSNLYYHIPPKFLDWEWRKSRLLLEFRLWSPDIMCLQEVDKFHELEEQLISQGYSGTWKMRTGNAVDGCAIFWKTNRFQLLYEENIEFNKLGMRENVAQICVFESRNQSSVQSDSASLPGSSDQLKQANRVVICNIHVLYNPKRGDIKIGQVRTLLDRAHMVSKTWGDAPVVICGDFNCTPKSSLYNFIAKGTVNLSGLARDQVSGQYSASKPYANSSINRNDPSRTIGPQGTDTPINELQNDMKNKIRIECTSDALMGKADMSESSVDSQATENDSSPVIITSTIGKQGRNSDTSLEFQSDFSGKISPDACSGTSKLVREPSQSNQNISERVNDHTLESSSFEINEPVNGVTGLSAEMENELAAIKKDFPEDLFLDKTQHNDKDNNQSSILASMSTAPGSLVVLPSSTSEGCESVGDCDSTYTNICTSEENSDPNFLKELLGEEDSDNFGDSMMSPAISVNIQSSPIHSDELAAASIENQESTYGVDWRRFTYNPYLWTPMEIEVASGSAECTLVEHNLKLRSVYTDVEDPAGAREPNSEPEVTSYHRQFMGTVDYIWSSEGLQTVKVLDTIPRHVLQKTPGFPTKRWGSDHLALACELAFRGKSNP